MSMTDGYSIRSYGRMIAERARSVAFSEALRRAVGPSSVVLDLGTGTGFFAFLACHFGAARVYAVEPDDAIEVAKACAGNIPRSERIVWLKAVSTEIDLPEKVDIVIGDVHGTLPMHSTNLHSLIDARRRFLKPTGLMIPARDVVRIVPAQAPVEYADVLSPWEQNEYALDLSAGRPFVANSWWRARPEPAERRDLLSSPRTWAEIDYSRIESPSVDSTLQWRIDRPGTLHGLYVWFDGYVADGLSYSNAPDLPELVYGRAFFPFLKATDVAVGDQVDTRMSATLIDGSYVFTWKTRITSALGALMGDFAQSTFNSRPIDRQKLTNVSADYVPTLNVDGQIGHAVMEAMARAQPLGVIARDLAARFPERFGDIPAALNYVAKLSSKYTAT